jgi:hypothetical protein
MPNLDRLASLSKRAKEIKVIVQPGGGQEGTGGGSHAAHAAHAAHTETAASSPAPSAATPSSSATHNFASPEANARPAHGHGDATTAHAAALSAAPGGDLAPILGDIRDALHAVATELRLARLAKAPTQTTEHPAADPIGSAADLADLRAQLDIQTEQLQAILAALKAK